MKHIITGLILLMSLFFISSCEKELSQENTNLSGNELIVGRDCRINKIVYTDTATGFVLGSMAATINILDRVEQINKFDSLAVALTFASDVVYNEDTIRLNDDEYFIMDIANNRVKRLHGLSDPTDVLSEPFDADFTYNATGYLIGKNYVLTNGAIPAVNVAYTYTGNNLTAMSFTNLFTGEVEMDAVIQYNNISPRNYIYVFPDEFTHPEYHQFLNFGRKPTNAVKDIKLKMYSLGIAVDSLVSKFDSYRMSKDNYVLEVIMSGDDQPGIPASGKSKLRFSYKCK